MTEQLKLHEGTGPIHNGRMMPYRDSVGKLTIGWGRNIEDRGISVAEGEALLHNDIDDHTRELLAALPWVATLDPVRRAVLVDMAFNMGVPTLLTFKNTLHMIREGKFAAAAEGMTRSAWHNQTKSRAIRLEQMMRTGATPFKEN